MKPLARKISMKPIFLVLALLFVPIPNMLASHAPETRRADSASAPVDEAKLATSFASLPMSFEKNVGQTDPRVAFLTRGSGYALFFTPAESVLVLSARPTRESDTAPKWKDSTVVRMSLGGATESPILSGVGPMPNTTNYLTGDDPTKWHSDVPNFAKVTYESVYPGIDLV
jgi:hypothetical protein